MTAKIGLEDVRIHAPHGFFEEEHLMGNEFSIDVEVEAGITGAAHDDDLGGTVNYATIYYLIQAEMKKPTQLLEALAYRMGNRIMNQFDSVTAVKLRLRKLNPPLGGKVGAAVVEVSLGSSGGGGGGYGVPAPRRQDTFEDPEVDFDERGGGGFAGGGFAGGGFSGGGMGGGGASFYPPPPPSSPPAFDLSRLKDMENDEDWEDGEDWEDDEDFAGEGELEGEENYDIPEADDGLDGEEYEGEDGDYDLGDMDMGDADFDADGFNFDDLKPGDFEGMDFGDLDFGKE